MRRAHRKNRGKKKGEEGVIFFKPRFTKLQEALQPPSMPILERPRQLAITDGKSQADTKYIYDNESRQRLYAAPSSLSSTKVKNSRCTFVLLQARTVNSM